LGAGSEDADWQIGRNENACMITGVMDEFQILFDDDLFDDGECSRLLDPAMARYGKLGFPAAAAGRPWIYANFVQTLDGIVSMLGDEAGGADIAGLPEDRWLMDLLRAHADAVMLGMGTLREEQGCAGHERAVRCSGSWTRVATTKAHLHRGR